MARNQFGGTASDVAEDVHGARVPGAMGTVWDGPDDTAAQLTDLTDLNGLALGQLVADEQGMVPAFYGPDGVEVLWVDFGGGRVAITPVDVGIRLKAHVEDTASDPHKDRAYADETFLRLDDAGWVAQPNNQATAKGITVPPGWGEFWRPKREAAKAGAGTASVAVLGGSAAVGFYASDLWAKSWPGALATDLQEDNGDGGSGFVSSLFSASGIAGNDASAINQWTASGNLVAQTGTWAIGGYEYGPGWGYVYASVNGASLTFTVRGTTVDLFTLSGPTASSWSYSIDGAAAVSITDTVTSGPTVRRGTVSGLSAGTHTVKLTHTGTAGKYLSVLGVSGSNLSGVVLNNFGRKNATAADYIASGRLGWNGGPSYPADLLIYALSPDDVTNGVSVDDWAAKVRQQLVNARDGGTATGATDIVFVLPHIGREDNRDFRYQDFVDRTYALANSFEAAVVNFWNLGRNSWNYWNSLGYWGNPAAPGTAGTDSVLLSDAGHSYMAGVLSALLNS